MPARKFTRFDKSEARRLREELEALLNPWLESRGLTASLGNAKFDTGMVRFVGPEFRIPGVVDGVHNQNLRRALVTYGIIQPNDPRTVFESIEYVLQDFRPRAIKNPWVALRKADGKTYVLTDASARVHFGSR
jgi:hypothetical protein